MSLLRMVEDEEVGADFSPSTGGVTFLLSDVDESARLWVERRDEMRVAVARHLELLEASIAGAGGVGVAEPDQANSVVGVFARAGDAVDAALSAYRGLLGELPWLPVRMALHTGEAALGGGGSAVGASMVRCARLRACGHGRQILVSETTAALISGVLGEGVALRDLGVLRVQELDQFERVWQLDCADLPSVFPPLRSLDAMPHNLPVPLSSFVGRHDERATVAKLVLRHRLVTLTGAGGSGKTRLAQHVAADLVGHHAGGTWLVELAPVTAAAEVCERLAVATGFVPTAGVDPLEQVCRHLRSGGPVLVILDNAEHVLDTAAQTAEELLRACPDVRVVVTSREPIGVPGELVWRVPSLSSPPTAVAISLEELVTYDAARLFIERARYARPNVVIDEETVPAIAAICARLDGIPLALELAAARVRTLPIERLSNGLAAAFRVLTGGARTVMARQQTLLASIEWSFDLLDNAERAVLCRLAVFPGSFELDGAEQVAGDSELVDAFAVLAIVGRLVDKSLVQLDDNTGRYRLLETVRQFCVDRLRSAGELDGARRRHAHYVARWCLEVDQGRHGVARGPIIAMMADVVTAVAWGYDNAPEVVFDICVGLKSIRTNCGHHTEFSETCDWLLRFDRDTPDATSWATAVAASLYPAVLFRRFDLFTVRDEVNAQLAADHPAQRYLERVDTVIPAMLHGDLDGLTRYADSLIVARDDVAISIDCGVTAALAALIGRSDIAGRFVQAIRDMTVRRSVPFIADTVGPGAWAAVQSNINAGLLSGGWTPLEPSMPQDVVTAAFLAATVANLALCMGDEALLDHVRAWTVGAVAHVNAVAAASVTRDHAVLHERWDDAMAAVADCNAVTEFAIAQGRHLGLHTMIACEAGRHDVARAWVTDSQLSVDDADRLPLPAAGLWHASALVHLADDDNEGAANAAHQMLKVASRHGLALVTVDALELLAVAANRRGAIDTTGRLLATAFAERARLGYRLVVVSPRQEYHDLVARTDRSAPAMTVDAAIEYARRSRGERTRPSHGWESLTPTEHQVVALITQGSTNPQIAQSLYMSVPTVKSHLTHIFAKLNITNRTHLATLAQRRQPPRH